MLIIGCDSHPSVQQIAWVDTDTGECRERRLRSPPAESFYSSGNMEIIVDNCSVIFRRDARKLKDLNPRLPFRYGPASAQLRATRLV